MAKNHGKTIVIVTHNQSIAMADVVIREERKDPILRGTDSTDECG